MAVIGEGIRVRGFALAGALVFPADGADEVRAAWRSLPAETAVVVLTPFAAGWLGDVLGGDEEAPPGAASRGLGPAGPGGAGSAFPGGRGDAVPGRPVPGGPGRPSGRLPRRPGVLTVVMPP